MPSRSDLTEHRPAHVSRTRHPTPWSRRVTRHLDVPSPVRRARPAPIPVFVDDSGRRRRAGRLLGGLLGALVLGYVAVVALTFAGAPLVGRLAPPGVDQLSRPAGDEGVDIGPGAQEALLPPAATEPLAAGPGAMPTTAVGDAAGALDQQVAASTTVPTPATTTTTLPGQGATTSVPTPSSTVPEHTHTTGGPPTEPPGKP
jgi:hypothetical protein